MSRPAPPLLARWLAARVVSRADREFFLGDLEEAFQRDALPRLGARGARRWYWSQVLRSIWPLLGRAEPRTGATLARGDGMLRTVVQDLRYALRMMRGQPGFTAVAVVTLALGIGANAAIFSIVNGVLLQPLPYDRPGGLVTLWTSSLKGHFLRGDATGPDVAAWRERNRSLEGVAAYSTQRFLYADRDEPLRLTGAVVTIDLFELLGVQPFLGRTFVEEEARYGADRAVIVSHGFWETRLGGTPDALDASVSLGGKTYRVVGVMPRHFRFPSQSVQAWVPLARDHPVLQSPGEHFLVGIGRAKPGQTVETVRADMTRIADELRAETPQTHEFRGVFVSPLRDEVVGGVEPTLVVLQGAVLFVLLIACVNVANLLVSRAADRNREIAMRAALGAGRWRLLRQLFTEGLALTLVGGAAGLGLAYVGTDLLLALNPTPLPRQELIGLDGGVLLFTLGLCLATGLVFGAVPAWRGFRTDLQDALKSGGRGAVAAGRGRLRHLTIALESGLALVLLIAAGLMLTSFVRLLNVDPGLQPDGVLALQLTLPSARYEDNASQIAFTEAALERIEALAGVEAAATTNHLPFSNDYWRYGIHRDGWPEDPGGDKPKAAYRLASPGYFRATHMPLIAGRSFDDRDRPGAPRALVVNETMAARYFPGESPIGQTVDFFACREQPCEIVGVVGDIKQYGPEEDEDPAMYGAFAQKPAPWMRSQHIVVRTLGDPLAQTAAVKAQLRSLDPELAFDWVGTLAGRLDTTVAPKRFLAVLLVVFAATALALAAIGIYGVMAYAVGRRRQEIGVRMALGARGSDILRMILRQGMTGTLAGLAAGLVVALALTRFMRGVLFAVEPTDPLTFTAVTLLLVAVAFVACLVPAQRGVRTDPLAALRDD